MNKNQNYLVAIVDDDEGMREAIKSLLASAGFMAESFSSAEEFLNSTRLSETSCLILDVQMPGVNGLELQSQLDREHRRIPIIFITAHANQEARSEAMRAGAVAFLEKPFSEESLMHALRSAHAGPENKNAQIHCLL